MSSFSVIGDAVAEIGDDQHTARRALARRTAMEMGFLLVARACLGLPNRQKLAVRNHCVSRTDPIWETAIAAGLATVRRSTEGADGHHTYRLTRTGAEAALLHGERLHYELGSTLD